MAQTAKYLPTVQETWVQSLGRLSESDITNQVQTHFQHFLFEVPHEQVWVGEEFGKSHSPALNTFGVEFSGHIQVMLFQNTSAQRDVTHLTFRMHIVIGSSQSNFMSSIPFDLYSSFLR